MKFRLKAFGLHLLASVSLLTLVLGGLYLGWYYWPGWYLTGVVHVVLIMVLVDAALGPALTLVIANPSKPRRELARDIAIIAAVQIVALGYGATALWHGRPLYYTFSVNSLGVTQANALSADEVARGWRENPQVSQHWYNRPRWVWAPLPDDPDVAAQIVNSAIFGGKDVTAMPHYFKPWKDALPQIRANLVALDSLQKLSPEEKQAVKTRMAALGESPQEKNALIVWGNGYRMVAILDPATLRVRAFIRTD